MPNPDLVIVKEPTTDEYSFVASANPIQYILQRSDFDLDTVENSSGKVRLRFAGQNIAAEFTVGDQMYIKSSLYDAQGEILSKTYSGGDTLVVLDITYVGATSGGIGNTGVFTSTYKLTVVIMNRIKTYYSPMSGRIVVDVSEIFRERLTYPDPDLRAFSPNDYLNPSFSTLDKIFIEDSESIITFQGNAVGYSNPEPISPMNRQYFLNVVRAAKQVTDQYRNNMRRYSVFNELGILSQDEWVHYGVGANTWFNTPPWFVSLNAGESSDELRFVDSSIFPTGRYFVSFVFDVNQMGGNNQIARFLFYNYDQLVAVKEHTVEGVEGDPLVSYSRQFEMDVNFEFNRVALQLFNNGNILTNGFVPTQLRFFTQKRVLTLMDKIVMWRGMPFTYTWLDVLFSGNPTTVIHRQLKTDGTQIGFDLETDAFTNDPNDPTYSGRVTRCALVTGYREADLPYLDAECVLVKTYLKELGVQTSETLDIEIRDACKNGILLYWKNSLGGDSWWMFEGNQEYSYTYDDGRKIRRMKLFADMLTPSQWDALNDMQRPTPVTEVVTDDFSELNKTHQQDGSSVFIVNRTGELTGVVVLQQDAGYETRLRSRSIEIVIELPTLYTT